MSAAGSARPREGRAAGPRRARKAARPAAAARRPPPRPAARKADPRDRLRRVLFLVPYAVRHPGIPVRDARAPLRLHRRRSCSRTSTSSSASGSPPFAPDDFLDLYVEGDRVYVALHQSFSRPPRFTESEAAALAAAAQALGGEGRERVVRALRDSRPARSPRQLRRAGRPDLRRLPAGARLDPGQAAARDRRAAHGPDRAPVVRPARRRRSGSSTRRRSPSGWATGTCTATTRRARSRSPSGSTGSASAPSPTRASTRPRTPSWLAPASSHRREESPSVSGWRRRAAEWALARPGGLSVVKRSARDGAVVEVAGVSEEWATRFALSFGGEAEVVAPASARRHYAEAVRLTLARATVTAPPPGIRHGHPRLR